MGVSTHDHMHVAAIIVAHILGLKRDKISAFQCFNFHKLIVDQIRNWGYVTMIILANCQIGCHEANGVSQF